MNDLTEKKPAVLEELLSLRSTTLVKQMILRLADFGNNRGSYILYRKPGGSWQKISDKGINAVEFQSDKKERSRAPEHPEGFASIPLLPDGDNVRGYYVVPSNEEGKARDLTPILERTLFHLELLEDRNQAVRSATFLSALSELTLHLVECHDAQDAIKALSVTGIKLFNSENIFLIVSTKGGLEFYSSNPANQKFEHKSPEALKLFLNSDNKTWQGGSEESAQASRLLGITEGSGASCILKTDNSTSAWLIFAGLKTNENKVREWTHEIAIVVERWLSAAVHGSARASQKNRLGSELLVMLAQEREKLDYTVRSLPLGILLCNDSGEIQMCNDRAINALGLTNMEIEENKIFRSRDEGRFLLGLVSKARDGGYPVETPCQLFGRWHNIGVTPWPGGEQFLILVQDIERWFKLDKFKGDLISIISHELKNPLTAIINASHLLQKKRAGELNENQAKMVSMIEDNGYKIRELLDDVVRLSRIEAAGDTKNLVELKPLLEETRETFKSTIEGKDLVWKEELTNNSVTGDRGMMINLFNNLVGNAVKYVSIGGRVGINMAYDDNYLAIRVIDNGPGIPEEDRKKLFTPFFRGSNVKDLVTGTGLGLVIARNVVERLGGKLNLYTPLPPEDLFFLGLSESEQPGSTFEILLPVETVEAEQ